MHFIYRDFENNPICEVKVSRNKKKVELINYEQNPLFRPFGHDEEITYGNVIAFLESRCYQRNYAAIDEILKEVGIKTYDPVKMCVYFEGRSATDDDWIEFLEV